MLVTPYSDIGTALVTLCVLVLWMIASLVPAPKAASNSIAACRTNILFAVESKLDFAVS